MLALGATLVAVMVEPRTPHADEQRALSRWRSPARPSADGVVRFFVIGDWGQGNAGMRDVAAGVARAVASAPGFTFGLTLGDNFYPRGVRSVSDARWERFYEQSYGRLRLPVYATLGNHDWYARDASAQWRYVGASRTWQMPAPRYSFAVGDVQLIALDTTRWSRAQASWLDGELRAVLSGSGVPSFDFFETYTTPLEQVLGIHSAPRLGKHHGIGDPGSYQNRMHAVHFAVDNDDGAVTRHYGESDLILVGVSRSGKTPTCLYLGLQYGVRAANYPLTDDDFERDNAGEELPQALRPYRDKLFGLRIEPAQLQRIRSERRPDSRYASLEQCQREIAFSDALFRRFAVPVLDVTAMSIEEIAARLVQRLRKPQM